MPKGKSYAWQRTSPIRSRRKSGAMAALMAQKGFTGHRAIIEASGGFNESVMGGQCDLAKLVAGGPEFKILRTNQKPFAVCSLSTGLVGATYWS